jgi:hypothetical protein
MRVTEAPWRMLIAKVFVLFLCGVQLVLRSGVLTVLGLDKVDVTPRFAEVFTMVTMVTMGGDLQPGCLADRLLTGLGQPQINP